jgi:transcriptional regulator with XRE-family HTH domain
MRLETWLELKRVSRAEFARRIDVSAPTITRVINGEQNTPLSVQDLILRETEGAVTPDDIHAAYAEAQARSAA